MDNEKVTDLLIKIGNGNHIAFNKLFTEYYPQVRFFLFGFIKDMNEASDLAQDIFIKIWLNRDSLQEVNNFKSYLFRSAKNAVLNYFEHTLVKQHYQEKALHNATLQPCYQNIIEDNLYAVELEILLDIAVEKMPERQKEIFKLSRKEGLSNDEIADLLHINKRTVENYITKALRELRKIADTALSLLLL